MRIQEIEFCDKDADWELAPTPFFPNLTLLVGISGVGKTRILRAISTLCDISKGSDNDQFWGVHWQTRFIVDDGSEYSWSGAYEEREPVNGGGDPEEDMPFPWPSNDKTKPRPKVIEEFLSRDKTTIIERDSVQIRLRGEPTPKLSPYESVLSILSEEDDVSAAHEAFKQVLPVDHSEGPSGYEFVARLDSLFEQHDTLEKIRNSKLSTKTKLALAHKNDRATFDEITARFKEVFPQVEQVDIKRLSPGFPGEMLQIRIKERGVGKWIPEDRISSGMSRTLIHLSRMALWPDGMVILIDEFENSLGVNCLDFVTDDLVGASSRHQFIITSHHPYIVNRIDTRNWKIVVRDGAVVSTRDASEFGLDGSRHEAFIKLMNLPMYQEGITVE